MKKLFLLLCAAALAAGCAQAPQSTDTPLDYADDVDGMQVENFDRMFHDVRMYGVSELHSVIVLQHGKVIYEKYAVGQEPDYLHILWSASKTFTAVAIGFAQQEGLLKLEDKVAGYFQDQIPAEHDSSMDEITIKDLLTMSSGLDKDYISRIEAADMLEACDSIFAGGMLFAPGERFRYNSCNTYLLSAIITKLTGQTAEEYLQSRLFEPLGIRNHKWEVSAEGYSMGGWGLHLTTRSFAKMGQFLLQKGMWDGKQLLSADFVEEASSKQIDNAYQSSNPDCSAGYGYQMWQNRVPGTYRLDGAWGQFCIVIPDKDAVVAINAHTNNTLAILDAVWANIYANL